MGKYHFYYDESEHSRKINLNTVNAYNYYDNFIAAIVGWKSESEESIIEKYIAFEEKYADRRSKGELKSQTLRQNQFENGFASMNKDNVSFLMDLFSIVGDNVLIYFAVISKIEYIIDQVFEGYKNSFLFDMDAMKYSIVKAILLYQPKEIIKSVFENTEELVIALQTFFQDRIQQNKANMLLKQQETAAFEEILSILHDVRKANTIDWDYRIAFCGFKQYTMEKSIHNFTLMIDKEGESSNTLNAAKQLGFNTVIEVDSKESAGIRMADMLAGVLAKLFKALHNALKYNSSDEQLQKKVLRKDWFQLNEKQFELYKKLYKIVCELNNAWYKTFSGKYSDDLVTFIALLNYMNHFATAEEIKKQNIDLQGEYFNSYLCDCFANYFEQMRNKLPINSISSDNKLYFFNQRGAKVFLDAKRQPLLKFNNGNCKCNVISVGFSKNGIPLITIEESEKMYCYRLPDDLGDWAVTVVRMESMGIDIFPTEVIFTEQEGKIYVDIL